MSNSKDSSKKPYVFPVAAAGKRELKRELRQASSDPERTIQAFQKTHSLHFMMSKAFGTLSIPEFQNQKNNSAANTRSSSKKANGENQPPQQGPAGVVESLDTDSVMTFLSHLGVRQYEVHKRISDTLLKQLDDEIRKTKNEESLFQLLREAWTYAVSLPELRPIIWSVLKRLGEKTPPAVLEALAERDEDGSLKHIEIFRPLPALLKKLVWEGDWEARFPPETVMKQQIDQTPTAFLKECEKSLLHQTIYPLVEQYCTNKDLCESANRPFVASNRERRLLTTQRRALTSATLEKTAMSTSGAAALLAGSVGKASSSNNDNANSGGGAASQKQDSPSSSKAIAQLRVFLSDSGGSSTAALSFRPKLLYALMTMLIARHGMQEKPFLAGAEHLHCTLVSDILLSSGGPLPKAYHHVHELARIIDECVQEGSIRNEAIKNIQKALREIFLTDHDGPTDTPKKDKDSAAKVDESGSKEEVSMTNALQRQLNHIITAGITALKESDPQSLFLNPVTDKIAPDYSKIIKQPICILDMEHKIDENEYKSVDEWKQNVELMFKNCVEYNKGKAGQWFRGEAMRQKKIFEEEIFPQARRLYQTEIVKRRTEEEDRKRKAMAERPDIFPLEKATKKRKKEKEEFIPSMPSLAFMIMTDPFFVRIVLDRVLREARVSVTSGSTLPAASFVIPSLLQLLHMVRWSTQICAIQAKRYLVPSGGLQILDESESEDPAVFVPYATLRQDLPLVLRLILEAELDKRTVSPAADLHAAAESDKSLVPQPIESKEWAQGQFLEVPMVLMQGAMVHICQPGSTTEASLAVTFPKFATGLAHLSKRKFLQDRLFFQCLIRAIVRHKTKLSKATRDAVVKSWVSWLTPTKKQRKKDDGSLIVSAAHECLIQLFNEWSSIGNQILPRDTLLNFVADVVKAVTSTNRKKKSTDDEPNEKGPDTFVELWNKTKVEEADIDKNNDDIVRDKENLFAPIKKQYLKMLKRLPEPIAEQWKKDVGVSQGDDRKDDDGKNGKNIEEGAQVQDEEMGDAQENEDTFTMEE